LPTVFDEKYEVQCTSLTKQCQTFVTAKLVSNWCQIEFYWQIRGI